MLMQIEKEAVLADLLARVTSDRTRREALVNELRGLWDLRRIRLHPSQTARS
jgi:carbamoyltransferase